MPNYVAEYRVHLISVQLMKTLCSAIGIRNHGTLSHKLRCELFLQSLGYEAAAIEEILLLIPERASRSRACDAEDLKSAHFEQRIIEKLVQIKS